ncbi:4395_t:CDS:2, partial [Entrophospora sp. SA101]
PKCFHIKEALIRYLEDMEDIQDALEVSDRKEKTYTTAELKKKLAKIDRTMAEKIVDKVENYLVQDPINLGERLLYDYKKLYRYRCGDYRVIYEVKNLELIISIVKIGHRKEVY